VHDPAHRQRLSYLATTRRGRRIYLNRTAVDADQIVVLSISITTHFWVRRSGSGDLPGTHRPDHSTGIMSRLTNVAPDRDVWPTGQEADEVAWLLGRRSWCR